MPTIQSDFLGEEVLQQQDTKEGTYTHDYNSAHTSLSGSCSGPASGAWPLHFASSTCEGGLPPVSAGCIVSGAMASMPYLHSKLACTDLLLSGLKRHLSC